MTPFVECLVASKLTAYPPPKALALIAQIDFSALQVAEHDVVGGNRLFVYTQDETSFQTRCLNMVLDLLASPDARVRQARSSQLSWNY